MRYKLEAFCEIDRFAEDSYCAIHNVSFLDNLKDVTKINTRTLGPVTMVCGGSPCQDFSVAGKEKGNVYKCGDCGHEWNPLTVHYSKRGMCPKCGCNRIEGTRSSLVCHFLRIVRGTKPKFGLFENVKALTNKKHRDTFELFLKELQEYGYNTYWKVLNAKSFGIPQNRERVIVVFVRKDLDNGRFDVPEGKIVPAPFLSLLDDDVEVSYYVGEKRMNILIGNLKDRLDEDTRVIGSSQKNAFIGDGSECPSLTQAMGSGGGQTPMIVVKACDNPVLALMDEDVPEFAYITGEKVEKFLEEYFGKDDYKESDFCGSYYGEKHHSGYSGAVWDGNKNTSALTTISTRNPNVLIQSGYIHKNADSNQVYDSNGIARTIKAEAGGGGAKTGWYLINPERDGTSRTIKANYGKSSLACFKREKDMGTTADCCRAAVRKLMPKECFRLMGFDDADYEAAKAAGVSNSQLYKQAGNSIVVDMLYYVLRALRDAIPKLFDDLCLLSLFSGIGAFEKALDKLGGPMEHDWDWEAWERMQDCGSDGFAASMRNGNRHTPERSRSSGLSPRASAR